MTSLDEGAAALSPGLLSDVGGLDLQRDQWLSKQLGMSVYRVQGGRGEASRRTPTSGSLVYCRVPSGSLPDIGELCRRGFEVVEVTVQLRGSPREVGKVPLAQPRMTVRSATVSDSDRVGEIASKAFRVSRFHRDPRTKHCADELKEEWARNLCLGKRGIACWVAERAGEVVGFLGIVDAGQDGSHAAIDLLAVHPDHQGEGIGQSLVLALNDWALKSGRALLTGTQLNNGRAIRFYEDLGFRVCGGATVLHGYT